MSSPFDPQPLTAAQQQQVEDKAKGNQLIKEVLTALAEAKFDFSDAAAISANLTHEAQIKPAFEVDVEGLIAQEGKYMRLQDLVRNLGYYLGGAQGWRFGIGQPNHETFEQLEKRLGGLYPDAASAVFAKIPPVVK